ncbi:MAG: hypothetical protein QW385_08355 [Thermoproteota archaeon]
MSHRFSSLKISLESCFLSIWLMAMLVLPFLGRVSYAANIDNGFAIGASYLYTGGLSDFNFYFYNNGFSTSNGYPEQIVLTASSTYSSYKVAYQISIFIYSSTNTVLDIEVWNISPPSLISHNTSQISGLVNSWHTIELKIYSSGGVYYVGYYLDGIKYGSYTSGSTFDTQMVPSIVIESVDTSSSDWNGRYVYGYLRNGNTQLSTYFYGGWWGYLHAGCIAQQSSTVYVGEDVQAPDIVGATGWRLNGYHGANQLAIGNMGSYFALTDSIALNSYNNFHSDPCTVPIG